MIYRDFKGEKISLLGFGCMRFPCLADGTIDFEKAEKMVDYAYKNGVNYFDTAHPYHNGTSEVVIGKILKKYPRESFFLADKYPGHQIKPNTDGPEFAPERIFEQSLKRCGVDYFDFYLLHNVCENSYGVYTDDSRNILSYFLEQKRLGRIKHLGFSSHAALPTLKDFLERYGQNFEFCQIQLNYLDWTLQDAKEKYKLITQHGLGVWVMESVRGGHLAKASAENEKQMKIYRPDESVAAWALRWLQGLDKVGVILSGMTQPEQVYDNIKTFEEFKPLNEEENEFILNVAESMKDNIPCTACAYCKKSCPKGLDIPTLINQYNDFKLNTNSEAPQLFCEALPKDKQPSACLKCKQCEFMCPQKIKISEVMTDFTKLLNSVKSWDQICTERYNLLHNSND